MQLPEYEHVVFEKSPLDEVICQVRFNDILVVSAELPTAFQERVRAAFPVLERQQAVRLSVADAKSVPVVEPVDTTWQFKSQDGAWVVSLTTQFVTLKSTDYSDFGGFLAWLEPVLRAFQEIYRPPFYTRVGLRYVNRFYQEREHDCPVRWDRFLNRFIAAEYENEMLRQSLSEAKHQIVLATEEGAIGCRYSRDVGRTGADVPTERFTLDFDHYAVGQIASDGVDDLLKGFNDRLYRLFRWCLTDEAVSELQPRRGADRSPGGQP